MKKQKNKNSYEEVLENEISRMKEELTCLQEKNKYLKEENENLYYQISDLDDSLKIANDEAFSEMIRTCGQFEVDGSKISADWQSLITILIHNGYTVEVTPLHNNTKIKIVVKESEDELHE